MVAYYSIVIEYLTLGSTDKGYCQNISNKSDKANYLVFISKQPSNRWDRHLKGYVLRGSLIFCDTDQAASTCCDSYGYDEDY
jgi:hypothetical protein